MSVLPESVQKVIDAFEKLPGIGPKSAARMAYHFLRSRNNSALELARSLLEMEKSVTNCKKCFNISESEICTLCESPLRLTTQLCVVEDPLDVVAFENSAIYRGLYFVLGGVISPADGIGADELRFPELKARVVELSTKHKAQSSNEDGGKSGEVLEGKEKDEDLADGLSSVKIVENEALELIIATNPNLEGEATAVYIQNLFKKEIESGEVKITRLAMGLPTGADLEYADRLTLKRALEGRRAY
jgi:recombination protein RecR